MCITIISYVLFSVLLRLPNQLIYRSNVNQVYSDLQRYRLLATYLDKNIIIKTDDLSPLFIFKRKDHALGFKPYFKTFSSNSINIPDFSFQISITPVISVINLNRNND
tara:strand:- start:966 stop:1289 length:324 start_codon:yes stop_codon:yes gene_type:complete